jgi:hypothetical protein
VPTIPYPGIPQLPPNAAVPVITLLASEAISSLLWQASIVPPAWGVFDADRNQVLFPDSVLEFSNRQEYEVSNYPVQNGAFASYNKVIRPFEISLRLSKGGTLNDRIDFLADIAALAASIALLTVVTPERTYQDVNLNRFEVTRRGAKGAYFLTEVDCYFVQIVQVQAQYTTTAVQLPNAVSPAALPTSSVGNVQPGTPSSQITQDGNSAMASQPPQFYGGG